MTMRNEDAGSPAMPTGVPGVGRPAVPLTPVTLRVSADGDPPAGNFYDQIGGRPTFEKLVREFYRGVAGDPVLVAMYPEQDLEGAIQRLTGFLEQYWGGPTAYSEERGHPRLRLRHQPFPVNPDARDRWLRHMRDAVDSLHLSPLHDATLWAYLERAAHAMVNTFDE
jgi:hemoglobin